MEKFLTVKKGNTADETRLKEYRLKCHKQRLPCVIVTETADHADISCDNWLGTDGGLIRMESRMMMEDRFQQLQKKYPQTKIEFTTSEIKASKISNLIPLWYNFTDVPLEQTREFAEKVYDIYLAALPDGN